MPDRKSPPAGPPAAAYGPDLAVVHDRDFTGLARGAATALLAALRRRRIRQGRVVDLGCGSGVLAAHVAAAGFEVVGVDVSEAMVRLAARAAPTARFVCASLYDFPIPACTAVTAIGEVVNYAFDPKAGLEQLEALAGRVHRALLDGGVLLLDVAGPGRSGGRPGEPVTVFHDTPDWSLGVIATEDDLTLTRDITLFRRSGDGYRKSTEQHVLRLYHPADVLQILESAGFHARRIRRYGDVPFRAGWAGFLAEKRG